MDPIERIKQNYDSLTRAEQRVAQMFLSDPSALIGATLTGTAEICGTSNAAVIRMCQKLGYDGFSEFKFSLNRYMLSIGPKNGENTDDDGDGDAASPKELSPTDKLMDTYIKYMRQIPEFVPEEQLKKLANDIVSARRIDIWGVNRTAQSASQLSNRLSRLGIYNKLSEDFVTMTDDSAILSKGDLCILFTLNGRGNAAYPDNIASLRKRGCTTWVITMNPRIKAAKEAENVVTLPWVSRSSKTNFYEDQIIVYMFIELLLYELVQLCPN